MKPLGVCFLVRVNSFHLLQLDSSLQAQLGLYLPFDKDKGGIDSGSDRGPSQLDKHLLCKNCFLISWATRAE